jgi:ATP-dependent RNA helicase DeaD
VGWHCAWPSDTFSVWRSANFATGAPHTPLPRPIPPSQNLESRTSLVWPRCLTLDDLLAVPRLTHSCWAQGSALRSGVDAVVGTPGRMVDLLDRGALRLSAAKFLVRRLLRETQREGVSAPA